MHYLEMLRDEVGFDKLKAKVVNPLKGRKIARVLRLPAAAAQRRDGLRRPGEPHHHRGLHRGHRRDAGEILACRNECCGGYVALEDKSALAAESASSAILASAQGRGRGDGDHRLPAVHVQSGRKRRRGACCRCSTFTELLAEALGVKE